MHVMPENSCVTHDISLTTPMLSSLDHPNNMIVT